MFTGIVEEIGTIENITKNGKSMKITVKCEKVLEDTKIGDSICTSGVCLTVTNLNKTSFDADIMPETYQRSSLKYKNINDQVNLERAAKITTRLGGHIVSGHVDTTGKISKIEKNENAHIITITYPKTYYKYIIDKGSIALDGVSLTVVKSQIGEFTVSLIPQTCKETTLLQSKKNQNINIECDVLGKYIYHQSQIEKIENKENPSNITEKMLLENGFL